MLYFSGLCDDAGQGKRLLHGAMNALLTLPVSESGSAAGSEDAEVKPTLLWSMLYIQELTTVPTVCLHKSLFLSNSMSCIVIVRLFDAFLFFASVDV